MVGINVDGPARDRVLKLMDEKSRIENDIRDQSAILESNHVGMHDSLVDDQGYPRNDIDVYKVRHARHSIICLQNDHKNIMKQIEKGLAEVHADMLGLPTPSNSHNSHVNGHNGHANGHNGHINGQNGHNHVNGSNGVVITEPFAVVSYVDAGSPAESAGLRSDDKIIQFGSLTHTNFTEMSQIYNIVTHSVGQSISVQVKRASAVVSVNLVPRQWAQPGLLGCHIQRINS